MAGADLTDSHAHLDSPELASRLDEILERARAAGVRRILAVPSRREGMEATAALAASIPGCWAAVGVHPHEASAFCADDETLIRRLAALPSVVAIGEIGIDHHYDRSPPDAQRSAFRRQLRLAAELSLPVVVHTREAEDETAEILEEASAAGLRPGVIHCFTSSPRLADRCLALGHLISFSGILTFRSSATLRETARRIPLDRLLVETDCPFLAPEPGRRWPNEPANVRVTAEVLAATHGVTLEELAAATSANFERVFLTGPGRGARQ